MTGLFRSLLIGVALGACALGGAAAQESSLTAPMGGPGGYPFRLECGEDGAVVGFNARVGNFVDSIQAVCRKFRGEGLVGPEYATDPAGGSGGAPVSRRCPAGSQVTGLSGSWNARSYNLPGVQVYNSPNYVHEVSMRCQHWNAAANRFETTGVITVTGRTPGSERRGANDFGGYCPQNTMASAIAGRSGVYIDSLSLGCSPLRISQPRFETFSCPTNVRATADVVGNDGAWKPVGGPALRFWRVWVENNAMICGYLTANDRGDRTPDAWRMSRPLPANADCRVEPARPGEVRCRGDRGDRR